MVDDLTETALFKELRSTPAAPNQLAEQVAAQVAFDDVLAPLGLRAPPPETGESNSRYLARLAEHAAVFGPEDRKAMDRRTLPPAGLAEVAREDLAIAKAEIDRPHYSLKEGETREVTKIDRSGRPFIEFYNRDGPGFWMDTFKDPLIRQVSGGSKGIAIVDKSGYYSFDKLNTNPELQEVVRRADIQDTAEYKVTKAYSDAGLPPPNIAELL